MNKEEFMKKKEEFLVQYCLNSAKNTIAVNGTWIAEEAIACWEIIAREIAVSPATSTERK